MTIQSEWLKSFTIPDSKLGISFNTISNLKFYTSEELDTLTFKEGISVFFTPAQHTLDSPDGSKGTVVGTKFGWVDCDVLENFETLIPPTYVVESGHGYHCYFKYSEPITDKNRIDQLNQILRGTIPTASSGSEWNANRLLRVIGTTNDKIKNDCKSVRLVSNNGDISYAYTDIIYLSELDSDYADVIRTGDASAFDNDRSKRDFHIIRELCRIGVSVATIKIIFANQPIGDKYREHPKPEHYLDTTIKAAQNNVHDSNKGKKSTGDSNGTKGKPQFIEKANGYYYGDRRISTFTLQPKAILSGTKFEVADAIDCVIKSGDITRNITLPKSAFANVQQLNQYLLDAEFSWLGSDNDLKILLPYLLETYKIPKITSVPTLGLHKIDNRWYFIGNSRALVSEGFSDDVRWIPNRAQHADVQLFDPINDKQEVYDIVANTLPNVYSPETIWTLIGWYSATILKPWIELHNQRFPILNVTGTKGGGKTTLVLLLQQIFGQKPKSKEGRTTKFVMISLLSSANAVPCAFSEFRDDAGAQASLYRMILLSYDGQQDARGRGDQTTVEYNLTSPFSVDGEDIISDPAAQERIVVAQTNPSFIKDINSSYKLTHEKLVGLLPSINDFATHYIADCLRLVESGIAEIIYQDAKYEIEHAFQVRNRVRNNHIATWFGIKLFSAITGCAMPALNVLETSLFTIKDRTVADEFIEALVLCIVGRNHFFEFHYEPEENVLYFNLKSAHDWWLKQRKQQGRASFEEFAIKQQVKESKAYTGAKVINDMLMYGISLKIAQESGMDVPSKLEMNKLIVQV